MAQVLDRLSHLARYPKTVCGIEVRGCSLPSVWQVVSEVIVTRRSALTLEKLPKEPHIRESPQQPLPCNNYTSIQKEV